MRSGWASRLLAEIHVEVLVDLQATVLRVTINLQEVGASLRDIGVELVVPGAVERVGNVQPLPIKAQLEHLWATAQLVTLNAAAFSE